MRGDLGMALASGSDRSDSRGVTDALDKCKTRLRLIARTVLPTDWVWGLFVEEAEQSRAQPTLWDDVMILWCNEQR